MMKLSVVFLVLSFFFFSSCAHREFRSGRYVRIAKNDTLAKLAQTYHVKEKDLRRYNEQKVYKEGDWIFIPGPQAILDLAQEKWPQLFQSQGGMDDLHWPVPGYFRLSSLYGSRDGKFHHGIDIPAPTGSTIEAVEDGYVIHTDNSIKGFGNLTIIQHGRNRFSIYAHSSKNFTQVGQRVKKGEAVALVGNTGHSSGPHLHFEWRVNNKSQDPMNFFLPKFGHLLRKN